MFLPIDYTPCTHLFCDGFAIEKIDGKWVCEFHLTEGK